MHPSNDQSVDMLYQQLFLSFLINSFVPQTDLHME